MCESNVGIGKTISTVLFSIAKFPIYDGSVGINYCSQPKTKFHWKSSKNMPKTDLNLKYIPQ